MQSAGEKAAEELSADAQAIQVAHVIRQLVEELKLQRELRDIAQQGLRDALRERDVLRDEAYTLKADIQAMTSSLQGVRAACRSLREEREALREELEACK
jgi:hypothetical protein